MDGRETCDAVLAILEACLGDEKGGVVGEGEKGRLFGGDVR